MLNLLDKVDQVVVLESDLYQRKLRNKKTGAVYNIDKVVVEKWAMEDGYHGWWIKLLIEIDMSHGLIYWQNINCTEPYIVEACSTVRDKFEWV